MTVIRLVLASASPARRRVLIDTGITPIVQVSSVDEDYLTGQLGPLAPADLALALAKAKAEDVAQHFADHEDTIVVGCDSVFEHLGVAYGKPHTAAVATERIKAMADSTGYLHTGHWAVRGHRASGAVATTRITFGPMSDAEIDAYVATGEPLTVAGSFTLDGLSAPFITGIKGDPSNVIGISLPTLRNLAGDLGIDWPDLWTSNN